MIQRATLSKIHIAKQQLGMDDTTYRAVLARVCGVQSAKELNDRQASMLLGEFKRLGWQPKPAKKTQGKPKNFSVMPNQIAKIEALLADMKLPWAYADALGMQMFKIERVAWIRNGTQLRALIAALHAEQEKRKLLVRVEGLCKQLNIDRPEQIEGLEQLPEGWSRQRPVLKTLIEALKQAVADKGVRH